MKQGRTCGIGGAGYVRLALKPVVLAVAALGLLGCPTTPVTPAGPEISVIPAAFNFGPAVTSDSFAVTNSGDGVLLWTIGQTPTWLSVDPPAGSTPVGGPTTVTMTIDRTGLTPGTYQGQFLVASNGGNRVINVTLQVSSAPLPPTLQVNPASLDFGETTTNLNLSVTNAGTGTVNWTINTAGLPAWLSALPNAGSTGPAATQVGVSVVRALLSPGSHSANINFTSNGGNISVPVSITVPGPAPSLSILPTLLTYGNNTNELQLTIRNTGTGTLNWNLSESLPWLSLSAVTGTTTSETDVVTATVDRTGQAAGDYAGTIGADSDGGTATIDVTMTVAQPLLVVTPTVLNFGAHALNKLFAISNAGTGTVNWTIDTSGFPGWLTVGTTAGSVSNTPEAVLATVNRAALTPGNYSYTFTVASDAGNVDVTVNVSKATQPILAVGTGGDTFGTQPQAALGSENQTFVVEISNGGTGTLSWSIDPDDFEPWLTMTPVQGTATGSQINLVTITVNRLGLSTGPYSDDIPIKSNGGNVTLHVTMVVPLRPEIGVAPEQIDFGLNDNTSGFSIANVGDPGTILSFLVVTNSPEWLFNSPSTGVSIGTASPIKDFKDINVSIDRGGLNGTSSASSFTIYALDAEGEIDEEIAPATVTVSVQTSPLSFQVGLARTRIPSIVRWDFLMRDFRNASFFVAPEDLVGAFKIFEDGVQLEQPAETTQVVLLQNSMLTASESDYRTDLRTTVMLLLDYSGSMKAWAESVGMTIQQVHEQVGGRFITDYFANLSNVERGFAKLGIMEFHDRSTDANVVLSPTTSSAAALAALDGIDIQDNGATALLPAIDEAATRLVVNDGSLIPFDTADIRAIVLLSDGRLTTPPGKIQDTIDYLVGTNTRLMGIGWGGEVNHEPLARLADGTGGHYYFTKKENDAPSVTNFEANAANAADDMATHTVLRYITLNEGDNVPLRFDGALNNPNDSPDQGVIQGTIKEQDIKLGLVAGDVLMGQLSLRSNGGSGGSTIVTMRADYMPRNVSALEFEITAGPAYAIDPAPLESGGIASTWSLQDLGLGRYRLQAPPGEVMPYGSIGDLVQLTFGGGAFTLGLEVDNSIYAGPEAKYFIYPDTLAVSGTPSLSPSLPTLEIAPSVIDFGTTLDSATFTVRNAGGTYPYGDFNVLLIWSVEDLPFFVTSVTPDSGAQGSTSDLRTSLIRVDRTINAGTYSSALNITYETGPLGLTGSASILLMLRVLPPVLTTDPSPLLIDFGTLSQGAAAANSSFEITNAGQSTLDWIVDVEGIPAWVTLLSPISDSTTDEADTVNLSVDPSLAPLGTQSWTTSILSNGGTVPLTIEVDIVP